MSGVTGSLLKFRCRVADKIDFTWWLHATNCKTYPNEPVLREGKIRCWEPVSE